MGSVKFQARLLTEAEYDDWNRLVTASPGGSIYSRPEYLDVLCAATGGRFEILGAFRQDMLVGGIGLYLERGRAGESLSNRLLLYYNGFVVSSRESSYPHERSSWQQSILTVLEEALVDRRFARVVIHNRHALSDVRLFLSRGWTVRPNYSFEVPIQDIEACWGRIQQNLRRLVRRCEGQGVVVGEDDDFDSFYRQHLELHLRKGSPVYLAEDRYRAYIQRLRELHMARLYHARLPDGESVAAQLVLADTHPVSHSVCATSAEAHLNLGASAYLRWKVFESLAEAGYAANDLTDASLNEVSRFKSQLGGNLVTNMVLSRPVTRTYRAYQFVGGTRAMAGRIARRIGRFGVSKPSGESET